MTSYISSSLAKFRKKCTNLPAAGSEVSVKGDVSVEILVVASGEVSVQQKSTSKRIKAYFSFTKNGPTLSSFIDNT